MGKTEMETVPTSRDGILSGERLQVNKIWRRLKMIAVDDLICERVNTGERWTRPAGRRRVEGGQEGEKEPTNGRLCPKNC